MRGQKILVIDDDIFIRQIVEEALRQERATVVTAANGHEGLRAFFQERPHLVILDVMMPYVDGWEVCRQIRMLSDTPVIMLTSLTKEENIVRGLDDGAVDYVTKPFSVKVLLARVRAALRQQAAAMPTPAPTEQYADAYLTIDLSKRLVQVEGAPVKLTKTEYKLLATLVQNAGIMLTFNQILQHVWGWEYQDSAEYVHVYISRLRKKLEPNPQTPRYLITEFGVGYRFTPQQ